MNVLERPFRHRDYSVVAMIEHTLSKSGNRRVLTPEEDSVGEPEEADDDIDDLLPADLWF
jgi:hypothetical protein